MFQYLAFGLYIQSEILLPELFPAKFATADVTIKLDKTPLSIEGKGYYSDAYSYTINDNEYLFEVKGISKYYGAYGNEIIIEPYPEADDRSVRMHILGGLMANILLQRGYIPLHVSAILKEGKLILFTGYSGAGKSTTLAQLHLQGYKIFTDDICVLEAPVNGQKHRLKGISSYPMLKLWKDSSEKLNNFIFESEAYHVKPGFQKFGHFFFDEFDTNLYPVEKIFILTKETAFKNKPAQRLHGIEAFKELNIAIFNRHQLHNTNLKGLFMNTIGQLVNDCAVYKINMHPDSSEELKPFPLELL